jgi:CO/xanthine dehydrogenase Mo-binding subunit
MMDEAAHELDLDPAELRKRNFIAPEEFPYLCVTGSRYDSGNYPEAMRKLLERLDYDGWRERQAEARADGRLLGVGVVLAIEPSSSTRMGSYNASYYSVKLVMDPAGRIRVARRRRRGAGARHDRRAARGRRARRRSGSRATGRGRHR